MTPAIFLISVVFKGLRAKLLFSVVACKFVTFAFLSKCPFLAGDKNTVYQKHRLCHPRLDNPQASYRAENPTNPKIGPKKTSPTYTNTPYGRGSKKYPEFKIPEKYPPKIRISGGILYLKRYFGESHVLYVGGYFCTSLAFLFFSWSRGCQPETPFPRLLWAALGVEK